MRCSTNGVRRSRLHPFSEYRRVLIRPHQQAFEIQLFFFFFGTIDCVKKLLEVRFFARHQSVLGTLLRRMNGSVGITDEVAAVMMRMMMMCMRRN